MKRKNLKKNAGQTVVEYVLMIAMSLVLMATIGTIFRRTLLGIWGFYIQKISAACPDCPPQYPRPL